MDTPTLTIAILSGGAASRLGGCDEGLALLDGRALVDHVLEAARAMHAGPVQLLVVANRHLDQYALRARTLADAVPGHRGPLAGVAAALGACTTPWLLTLPVDCPDPPADLHARLAQASCRHPAHAVVAHDGERRQPLFALYRCDLAAAAAQAVATGHGVARWQDAIGARDVDFSDRRRHFINLNTPEDFIAHAIERC
jgi:molybdopterin-guanine dinucleotide biosynthesis protein A